VVMSGGVSSSPSPVASEGRGQGPSNVTSLASAGATARGGASPALKAEPETGRATALDQMQWTRGEARAIVAEKRAEAKAKGYEGEACGECGNFTLVRNGTCMKCDTCGSTTGCS
jgi:ribonucleoside-diphosphate reductase alpha chain